MDENTTGCIDIIDKIKLLLTKEQLGLLEYITIFGEWAGKGIQKKVAISELPKAFYMFGVHIKHRCENGSDYWLSSEIVSQLEFQKPIYNLYDFQRPRSVKRLSIIIYILRISDCDPRRRRTAQCKPKAPATSPPYTPISSLRASS